MSAAAWMQGGYIFHFVIGFGVWALPYKVLYRGKVITINWISPRPGLAGGVKSNRLIAEAMVRRGHRVNIVYVDLPPQMPPIKCQDFYPLLTGIKSQTAPPF